MSVDNNSSFKDYNSEEWIEQYKAIVLNDPIKVVNPLPTQVTTTTGNGLWSQINPTQHPYKGSIEDPWEKRLRHMEEDMKLLKTEIKLSRLKILSLEGKFNQEEVANIRKMIMSDDEAARTLADSIIENA